MNTKGNKYGGQDKRGGRSKRRQRMLSLLLTLCLCTGLLPGTNASAADLPAAAERTIIAADGLGTGDDPASGETGNTEEIELPQNGSEVHMEDPSETQPYASRRRQVKKAQTKRYTVLVLDTSSAIDFIYNGSPIYTADTSLLQVREASRKFVEAMGDAADNYTAIVSYGGDTAKVLSQFTNDTDALLKAIDALNTVEIERNVHNGLTAAEELIDSVPDSHAVKNVVLFTTGMTSEGPYSYAGHYNSSTVGSSWYVGGSKVRLYAYANSAYEAAEQLKAKCTVYSIGLFQVLENMPPQGRDLVKFFKLCACDWASSKNHFYDVKDPANLTFVFGQVADNILKCTGTFSYPGKDKDYTAAYYYDDTYFKTSSYEHNQRLATMSLCLELSAWGSEGEVEYPKKMKNAEALLNELGFIGFDQNYTEFAEEGVIGKPTKDSVGVVAAHKPLRFDGKEYTLIALAVRGGGYEREWASNFTMGEDGHHAGFSQARDIVVAFLQNYIKEQGISGDLKIWITGYSRAAATANMVAGAIDSGAVDLAGCRLELKDLFAYTFETPAGVVDPDAKNARYSNIFNVINRNDPVPLVAPKEWHFTRYGEDKVIPSPETDGEEVYEEKAAVMLKQYRQMDGYESYDVDDFRMKKFEWNAAPEWNPVFGLTTTFHITKDTKDDTSQSKFLEQFVTLLSKEYLKDRTNYVAKFQSGMRDVCGVFFGTSAAKQGKLFNALTDRLYDQLPYIIIAQTLPKHLGLDQSAGDEAAARIIADCVENSLDETGMDYTKEECGRAVTMLCDLVCDVVENDPYSAATLLGNMDSIGQAHEPELCLAWMQSMDTNYTTDAKLGYSTGKYRIVRINCPIDVAVYDGEGRFLASIIDDTPQPDGLVVVSLNREGEKVVYLPVYQDYVIKLTATDDGAMDYVVQEYDYYAGETNHMVLFQDIALTAGQEYTAYLPSYGAADIESTDGTAADTDYTLFLGADRIAPTEELAGEEVFNAYYDVDAVSEDPEKGLVLGSGIRQYGTFAKVEAYALAGYEFAGWYEDGSCVSTEPEYRFRVSKDTALTAAFREGTTEETPGGNTGGQTDQNTDTDK
ncbi:MAG: VWA domain-containing protein, partial [Muribaculum sp.]|nr:VWA domain-containing protein [Muribaculum sp.]